MYPHLIKNIKKHHKFNAMIALGGNGMTYESIKWLTSQINAIENLLYVTKNTDEFIIKINNNEI